MNKSYMLLAIKEARKNLKSLSGGPFGACIVKGKKVLAVARNTVLKSKDATCHAEISAIKLTSKKLKNHELKGCEIYSTTEPCPMCFSAIHWAKIDKIYFGTRTSDVKKYFNELPITDAALKRLGKSKVKIVPNVAWEECNNLLKDWGKIQGRPKY